LNLCALPGCCTAAGIAGGALLIRVQHFGQRSRLLRTPGHTPGHSSLLVKLSQMGPAILSGDAVHFRENYDNEGVPIFNYDRAQTIASIQRMKQIASNLKATLIIQHDARDIGKLPEFPAFAK